MFRHLLSALFVAAMTLQAPAAGTSFSLVEKDNTGVARTNAPVTIGVPFPKGYITAARGSSPAITVDGTPAQTEVLSTWPDNTAKWVLLNYVTSLGANATQSKSVSLGGAAPSGSVNITWDGAKAAVSTGALSFEINGGDNFNMIQNVSTGGQVHVGSAASNGLYLKDKTNTVYKAAADTVIIESPGPLRGVVLVEGRFKNGSAYLTPNNPTVISTISSPRVLHVRFKMRVTVFTGLASVKVELMLHNPGAHGLQANEVVDGWCQCPYANVTDLFTANDGTRESRYYTMQDIARWTSGIDWEQYRQWLDVKDYYVSLSLEGASTVNAAADNGVTATVSPGQTFRTLQCITMTNASASGGTQAEIYQVLNNGSAAYSGTRGQGWMELVNGGKRLVVAQKHFFERAPHVHAYGNGALKLGLLPDSLPANALKGGATGYLAYSQPMINSYHRVTGGKWIGKTLFLEFTNSASNPQAAANFAKTRQHTLMPVPEAAQLHKSNAVDGYYPDSYQDDASGFLHTALLRREKLRRSFYDETALEPIPNKTPTTIKNTWDNNPAWGYGWRYAGDISWSGTWPSATFSNLHYDWPYGMTVDFLRAPHQDLWDMAELMVSMRTEIGQYHHREGMMWADGGGWYEKTDHYIEPDRPRASHNWNGGVCLNYYLTGNRFVRDAAKELGDFYYWRESWNSYGSRAWITWRDTNTQAVDTASTTNETRHETWAILSLVETYELTGEEKYLQMAVFIYKWYVYALETKRGTQAQDGLVHATGPASLQIGYAGYPLCRLYDALKMREGRPVGGDDPDAMAAKIGVTLKAIHDFAMISRTGGFQGGTIVTVPEYLGPSGMTGSYNQFFSAVAACLYKHNIAGFHNASIREIIEENLSYFTKYYGGNIDWSVTDYNDRTNYSATAFASNRFPGTETKQFGWDGLFNPYAIRALYLDEDGIMADAEETAPAGKGLSMRVSPNPFNPVTHIQLRNADSGMRKNVKVSILDISGRVVFQSDTRIPEAGITWDARNMPSGLYVVKLKLGNKRLTRKITLLK